MWLNHYYHHNRTEEQNKSPSVQRNDTLTIFPYIKSTKNYPAMCVGELYIGFFINILDQLDDKDQIYLIYHQNQCLHVIHTLNYLQ